jgi:hypothetical protein
MNFREIVFSKFFFQKSTEKFEFSLKSQENYGYFTWTPMYIYDNISFSLFYKKKVLDKFVEEIKTHLIFDYFFFRKSRSL